jgi:hypothetical protein
VCPNFEIDLPDLEILEEVGAGFYGKVFRVPDFYFFIIDFVVFSFLYIYFVVVFSFAFFCYFLYFIFMFNFILSGNLAKWNTSGSGRGEKRGEEGRRGCE